MPFSPLLRASGADAVDPRDAQAAQLRSWLGAVIALVLAFLLICIGLAVDPALRNVLDVDDSGRFLILGAALLASLGVAAAVYRTSAHGDVPSVVVIALPALPWLLAMPHAPAADSTGAAADGANLAASYANILSLAGLGSQLASVLLLCAALGLAVSLSSSPQSAPTPSRLALLLPPIALASVPLWAVFVAGVSIGLDAADACRMFAFVLPGTIAAALAVSVAAQDARAPRAAMNALIVALGVAAAARAAVETLRIWPTVDVLSGATSLYETAQPATFLGLAFQLAACAPLVVVVASIARRGAGASPSADDARGPSAAKAWTLPLAIVALVVLASAPLAQLVGLRNADERIRALVKRPSTSGAPAPAGARALVFDVSASPTEVNRALASVELDAAGAVVVGARHPRLFSEHVTRLLPLLDAFWVSDTVHNVAVGVARGPYAGRVIVLPGGSRVEPGDAAPGALLEIENEGGGVVDVQRAVLDVTARGFKPVLAPFDPSAGMIELARREARDFAAQQRTALVECAKASPQQPAPARIYLQLANGTVTRAGFKADDEQAAGASGDDEKCIQAAAKAYGFATPGEHRVDVELRMPASSSSSGSSTGGQRVVLSPPPTPTTEHELTSSEVLVVIKAGLPQVNACSKRYRETGTAKASWFVDPSGKARDVRMSGARPPVLQCIEGAIKSWSFPASKSGKQTSIPFKLE